MLLLLGILFNIRNERRHIFRCAGFNCPLSGQRFNDSVLLYRRPFNLVKAAYILARYVPLLALMRAKFLIPIIATDFVHRANYVLVHVYLAPRRTSGFICRIWYSFLFLTLQLCSVSLNTVLFLRGMGIGNYISSASLT